MPESAAYLVCTQLSLDSGEYSLPYVARWADGDIELIRKTTEQDRGHQRHRGDRDRGREAGDLGRQLEQGRAARRGSASTPGSVAAEPVCAGRITVCGVLPRRVAGGMVGLGPGCGGEPSQITGG